MRTALKSRLDDYGNMVIDLGGGHKAIWHNGLVYGPGGDVIHELKADGFEARRAEFERVANERYGI